MKKTSLKTVSNGSTLPAIAPHQQTLLQTIADSKAQLDLIHEKMQDVLKLVQPIAATKAMAPESSNGANIILFKGNVSAAQNATAVAMAESLNTTLYRVDLFNVIASYIGETEKNLDKIFTEAAEKNALLFFDEADALFRKRTTVKDAHDKFANAAINYLLQRIESYKGVVIIAGSNRRKFNKRTMQSRHSLKFSPDGK